MWASASTSVKHVQHQGRIQGAAPRAPRAPQVIEMRIHFGQNTSSLQGKWNLTSFNIKADIRDSKFLAAMVIQITTYAFMWISNILPAVAGKGHVATLSARGTANACTQVVQCYCSACAGGSDFGKFCIHPWACIDSMMCAIDLKWIRANQYTVQ
jgi:hypothetical protein